MDETGESDGHLTEPAGVCQICGRPLPAYDLLPAELVRGPVRAFIKRLQPAWSSQGFICLRDLNDFRARYVQTLLETETGELSALDAQVVRSLQQHELVTRNVNTAFEKELSLGERVADRVAEFGGSWSFILLFGAVILGWILINSMRWLGHPFDPFPFILLNLLLSCLAALQAPIIMMSQNRQEAKDRLRGEHDYRVDLKAELEIRHLHEKIDHMLRAQWLRLMEIQQIQMELMEELARRERPGGEGAGEG